MDDTGLDLTEAIEKLALLMTGRLGTPLEDQTWEDLGPGPREVYVGEAKEVIDLVAPIIARAVRKRAAAELMAWAETKDHTTSLRRHIGMCARRVEPEPTEDEIREALGGLLSGMAGRVCHLDEAGRAIPPGDGSGS